MPTSALEEVTNSPQISVKTVQSAGSMRCPQASFEAQPRIARLLAPKMGIDPYTETGSAYVCAAAFRKNQLHSAGGQRRPPLQTAAIGARRKLLRSLPQPFRLHPRSMTFAENTPS